MEAETCDLAQIRAWWEKWPDALIGQRPGSRDVVVFDIDTKDGKPGRENWNALGVDTSETMEVRSRSGGTHYSFARGDFGPCGNHDLMEGINVRADNGYIILPSPGSGYKWIRAVEPPLMPHKLRERLRAVQGNGAASVTGDSEEILSRYDEILRRWRPKLLRNRWLKVHLTEKIDQPRDTENSKRSDIIHRMENELLEMGASEEECFALVWRSGWCKYRFDRRDGEKQLWSEIAELYGLNGKEKEKKSDEFRIWTSAEFIAQFRPPDWFVDGVLQRGYLYAMTGVTGHGKTSVAMRLAQSVEEASEWGGAKCEHGDVVYFAGENPDDVRWRWIAMGGKKVYFIVGTQISLRDDIELITAEVERLGIKPALIVIDTKAAFFEDEDEDKNVAAIAQAADLRSLTGLPGHPAVVVLCHPTKHARSIEQLTPRGGGAFIAALDGNLTCMIDDDEVVTVHHTKLRGAAFDPLRFSLEYLDLPEGYVDTKGRAIKTVIAKTAVDEEIEQKQKERNEYEIQMLRMMVKNPGSSLKEIAEKLWWFDKDGKPSRWRVQRIMKRLKVKEWVEQDDTDHYRVTRAGKNILDGED
jgi:hypothetical protein